MTYRVLWQGNMNCVARIFVCVGLYQKVFIPQLNLFQSSPCCPRILLINQPSSIENSPGRGWHLALSVFALSRSVLLDSNNPAAVWIMISTYRVTALRSDSVRSSIVQTHDKRQRSLNKQWKDGRNPPIIGREGKHRNWVIYFRLHRDLQGIQIMRVLVCCFTCAKIFYHLSSHSLGKSHLKFWVH